MRGRPRTRSPSWRRGKGEGRGGRFFCPACQPHEGKTQDLAIGDKGFICHKCRPKGDLLKRIEVAGDMTFPSAVAWLEGETGIASPGHRKRGIYKGDI